MTSNPSVTYKLISDPPTAFINYAIRRMQKKSPGFDYLTNMQLQNYNLNSFLAGSYLNKPYDSIFPWQCIIFTVENHN
jgi:hypothetical protein